MIDMNKFEILESRIAELASSVVSVEEGTPMVFTSEGGITKVKEATGAADEFYAGCSFSRPTTPGTVPIVELLTCPDSSPYTITLSKTMKGTTIKVVSIAADGTRTAQTAGAPASTANQYSISNGVITLNSGQSGLVIEVTYKYDISLNEAVMKYNFATYNTVAGLAAMETTSLLTGGRFATTCYDITKDWQSVDAGTKVTLGDGVYTIGGSGTELDMIVEEVPSASSNGLLVLRAHP